LITTVEETNRSLIENLSNLEKELVEIKNYKELSHSDQKRLQENLNKLNVEKDKALTKFQVK
jgi:hypothetical protein